MLLLSHLHCDVSSADLFALEAILKWAMVWIKPQELLISNTLLWYVTYLTYLTVHTCVSQYL